MRRRNVLSMLMLTAAVASTAADGPPAEVDAAGAFDRLKALAGTWVASGSDGKGATTTFELTAGGTVLVERYANPAMPGGGRMLTAYHLDGGSLVLTHYCIANNQPTLQASSFDASTGELQFEFVSARNLKTPATGHMRRAKYRIVDRDHFATDWEFFENGTRKMTESETFTRVK